MVSSIRFTVTCVFAAMLDECCLYGVVLPVTGRDTSSVQINGSGGSCSEQRS